MTWFVQKPQNEVGATWPAILIGSFMAFGGILYGYDTGTISGIQEMRYWQNEFDYPSAGRISLIVSVLSIGTFVGALSAGFVSDLIGRRWGIFMACAIPFNLGVALQTAAAEQNMFIVGRFFAGLGVGLLSAQVPMYQSETLPKWIRGFVVGMYQLAITIGLFLAAIVNYATRNRNDSGSYRIPLAVQFAWSIILMVGLLFLPETPRYLIKRDNHTAAARSLAKLRRLPPDHPAVLEELAEIAASYRYELSLGKSSWLDLVAGPTKKRLITGVLVQALQQLVGVNFVFYYGVPFFRSAGFGGTGQSDAFTIQVITNVVNVVSTLPGLWAVEALGRRNLLLIGAAGMGLTQYIVAAIGAAVPNPTAGASTGATNVDAQRAIVVFVCLYIFFFAASWGPVAWVVTGEIFPLRARARGLAATTATNWFFNWLLAFVTPYLTGAEYAELGTHVFWIWGTFAWIAVVVVWLLVYETKGLSLEEVDEMYGVVAKAWRSKGFVPAVRESKVAALEADDEKAFRGGSATHAE